MCSWVVQKSPKTGLLHEAAALLGVLLALLWIAIAVRLCLGLRLGRRWTAEIWYLGYVLGHRVVERLYLVSSWGLAFGEVNLRGDCAGPNVCRCILK